MFSAALPAILAVTASESIVLLQTKEGQEHLAILADNAATLRSVLDKSEFIETTSSHASPITHYRLNEMAVSTNALTTFRDQERILQEIVDEVFYPNDMTDNRQMTMGL